MLEWYRDHHDKCTGNLQGTADRSAAKAERGAVGGGVAGGAGVSGIAAAAAGTPAPVKKLFS